MLNSNQKKCMFLVSVLGLILLIVHGLEQELNFKIDMISIALLAFVFLPFLGMYFERIKAGEFEVYFHALPIFDQIVTLIKSISKDQVWTFYRPRDHEKGLGDGIKLFVEDLLERDYEKMQIELKNWLRSGDTGLKWIASEIIGYFSLQYNDLVNLKSLLPPLFKNKDFDEPWAEWQLNCFWAFSKINDNYNGVHKFLKSTKYEGNQKWLLDVYEQMPLEGHANPTIFAVNIRDFLNRPDLTNEIKCKAKRILNILENLENHPINLTARTVEN